MFRRDDLPPLDAGELRVDGEALFGARWQSALSRAVNVSDRRVRQWLKEGRAPGWLRTDLAKLKAAGAGWPRDEWLIGTDPEGAREYIMHLKAPRFIGRIASNSDQSADTLTGTTYACRGGEMLCEIVWIDPAPLDEPSLLRLFQIAESALDIYTDDSAEGA